MQRFGKCCWKATTYIRCFIDMILYNNFGEETEADVLWKKIGGMCLVTSTGCRLVLGDARHVQEVQLNLISASRLDDEGYMDSIWNGIMNFYIGSLIKVRAWKTNTLYVMHARLCRGEVNLVAQMVDELWHTRLCHMSQKGM